MKQTLKKEEKNQDYSSSYSEPSFWAKVTKFAGKVGKEGVEKLLLLFYALKSGKLSAGQKAAVIAALGYFIAPFDLVPDAIPLLGFADDIAVIAAALKKIMDVVKKYPEIRIYAQKTLSRWFGHGEVNAETNNETQTKQ